MNLDFSSVPSREPLEEGLYECLIKKVEEKTSSNGKPMISVLFEETESKAGIFENYVIQENCLWKLKELLDAVGMDTSAQVNLDTTELEGVIVKCKVIQDEYNGDIVNRVKKIFAA